MNVAENTTGNVEIKSGAQGSGKYIIPLITLTLLFFMWGFITCMNDILIPYLKKLFDLSYTESMLVQLCFFGAYFIGSFIYFVISHFYGDPINKIGYKKGIIFGVLISAFACCLFYPAATFGVYALFLGALFILGLGFTMLQITANAYVTLLGNPKDASSRLNMTQAFNSLGTTIAPMIGGHLLFSVYASANHELSPQATRMPYLIFAGILLLIALIISFVKLPNFEMSSGDDTKGKLGALKFPQLKLGVLGIFFYVGAEVGLGSLMISYIEKAVQLTETAAKEYLALYWGGAMIGRFIASVAFNKGMSKGVKLLYMIGIAAAVFILLLSITNLTFADMKFFLVFIGMNIVGFMLGKSSTSLTLILFAIINILLVILGMSTSGYLSVYLLLGAGLFNSIMFSNIFTLGISGLGKYTSQGSSLLVMAILGGALLPFFQGVIADKIGLNAAYILPIIAYLYIAAFGLFCYKKKIE